MMQLKVKGRTRTTKTGKKSAAPDRQDLLKTLIDHCFSEEMDAEQLEEHLQTLLNSNGRQATKINGCDSSEDELDVLNACDSMDADEAKEFEAMREKASYN